jgi:hypothetical protein
MNNYPTGIIKAVIIYFNLLVTNNNNNKKILKNYNISPNILLNELVYTLQDKLELEWDVVLNDANLKECIQNVFDIYSLKDLNFNIKNSDIIIYPNRISDNILNFLVIN